MQERNLYRCDAVPEAMPGRATQTSALREHNSARVVTDGAPAVPPTPGAPEARAGGASGGTGLRPEIQGLRAIAVLLVVVYHLWPSAVPGGYVGVDVFFAISGFLITAHLLKEAGRSGRVSLPRFWARRARRLLPASLTVLLFCAALTLLVVPQIYWQSFFGDISASAGYIQNWHLAASSVDYLASAEHPSPVQHFWSLAAEEQFYLVWPILILLATSLVRVPSRAPRATLLVLGTVTALSLAASILYTASNPTEAYFVTPTRAWEFGAGGLLAVVAGAIGPGAMRAGAVRSLVSWAGLGAITVAAFTYTDATAFPGIAAALPVLGTLAVMWAGAPAQRWSPTPLLSLRPVQLVGDISYGIYLWHWPLLVLAPFVLGHGVGTGTRIAVLVAGIGAAWVTKLTIEDPVRSSSLLMGRRPRLTFALAVVATGLVLVIAAGGTRQVQQQLRQATAASARTIAAHPHCFGAASHDPARRCANPALRRTVVPKPLEAKNEPNPACTRKTRVGAVSICEFGAPAATARRTFALIGDSHATHWRAGLEVVARRKAWHGLSITHTGCPFSRATYDLPEPARSRCVTWNRQVPQQLARHPEVDTVFVSNITGGNVFVPPGKSMDQAKMAGYRRAWAALPPTVKRVVVIRDTPKSTGSTLECVDAAITAGDDGGRRCGVPRSKALIPDPAATAARSLGRDRAQVIDMTRYLCDTRTCPPVIGGVLVYKDVHHLTRTYATTLGRYLQRKVDALELSWR
ncbi:MAG: acyltransferase [Solirubrobacterales bacterium]|nr:acyltransferase [Solirubrobacterales bacterium]